MSRTPKTVEGLFESEGPNGVTHGRTGSKTTGERTDRLPGRVVDGQRTDRRDAVRGTGRPNPGWVDDYGPGETGTNGSSRARASAAVSVSVAPEAF